MVHYSEMNPAAQKAYFAKLYRKGYQAIPFNISVVLSTLAEGVLVKVGLTGDQDFLQDAFVISAKINMSIRGLTAGEGPLQVGLAHSDLTVTEIGESLDANLLEPDNIIQKERARRPVRRVGYFPGAAATEVLNNGVPIHQIIKMVVNSGHRIVGWIRNQSGATLTTGAVFELQGVLSIRWK